MSSQETKPLSSTFQSDFLASIVVFLVALPLCMGIAIASGVPVAAGLITGIVGGLVVATISGCPLQVSGPAAGLTVIIFDFVQEYGFEMLGIAVLLAGTIQLTAGIFRLGQWFRAVSPAVIKGMLAGIGVLIFASQFHVMVDDSPKGSGLQNLLTIPAAIQKGLTWPEFGTRETRQVRTAAIRNIGELHRRQEAIAERVAERLPDHSPEGKKAEETPEEIAAHLAALQSLFPEQQKLMEDVEKKARDLEKFEREEVHGKRSKDIVDACEAAIAKVREASKELHEGHVPTAIESQKQAVLALGGLLAALKNHALAAQIGILTILIIVLWQTLAPKKLRFLPAPLLAIIISTGFAAAISMPVIYVEVPDYLWDEIHIPTWAMLTDAPWTGLIQAGIIIAVVASAETLLCTTAVDQLHQGQRAKYDKELTAQGVGNMICGFCGALPMTGVIVRSTANLQSGGKTRLSAFLHGVWLLVFVVFLSFLLRLIPTSALAAILVYTGYKLMTPRSITELRKYGWGEVGIFAATVIMIVVTDLLTGVIVGIALAAVKLLYTFSHLHINMDVNEEEHKAVMSLAGAATFIRLPKLANALENVPANSELHVDLQHLDYIDHACLDLMMNWAKQHESTGGRLVIDWESLHARFRVENNTTGNRRAIAKGDEEVITEKTAAETTE